MSVLRNITFRNVTALALLALMLVIHGVKVFHEHPAQHKSYNETAIHAAVHHCAICDYHITKDADVTTVQTLLQLTQPVAEITVYIPTPYNTAHPLERCLRGPPATC